MEWKKFVLTTTTQAVELVEAVLMENGIDSFELEDNRQISQQDKEAMYIDILPELKDDGVAKLIFYMDMDINEEEKQRTLDGIREGLNQLQEWTEIGEGTIEESVTGEEDWINRWKAFFKPFTIDGILIRPTWEKVEDEGKYDMVIKIDPGTAFGTGLHETTRLCIRQLHKNLQNRGQQVQLLDVGCGSGILSIIAKKYGASYVLGTDIDGRAVEVSRENAVCNDVLEGIDFIEGNLIQEQAVKEQVGFEKYDIVVANILADVIIPLSRSVAPHLKEGGLFITSGIIKDKESQVVQAITDNPVWALEEITRENDWVSVTARKRS